MALTILQQPDGKWALWSTVGDRIEGFDFSERQLVKFMADRAWDKEAASIEAAIEKIKGGRKPTFAPTWEEAVAETRKKETDEVFIRELLAIKEKKPRKSKK